jgi:hypothetical protein
VRQAISEVLPYALGVAISPIPIIAVILMLFSSRAKTNGPAFLLGWVIGLGVVVAVAYAIADANDVGTSSSGQDGSSTVQVVLGVVLLVLALRNWRKRPAPGEEAAMPKWMATIDAFTPVKALGLAVLLSAVNPKNLILSIGAAAAVAQGAPSTSDATVALVVFVVLASLSIAVPVLFYLLGGAKAKTTLDDWKAWLSANNATVMAVLLLVFGVVLVGKGTGHFS